MIEAFYSCGLDETGNPVVFSVCHKSMRNLYRFCDETELQPLRDVKDSWRR